MPGAEKESKPPPKSLALNRWCNALKKATEGVLKAGEGSKSGTR